MIHKEEDIVRDIDSWTHPRLMELVSICNLLIKSHKDDSLGVDDRVYLLMSLLDQFTNIKKL